MDLGVLGLLIAALCHGDIPGRNVLRGLPRACHLAPHRMLTILEMEETMTKKSEVREQSTSLGIHEISKGEVMCLQCMLYCYKWPWLPYLSKDVKFLGRSLMLSMRQASTHSDRTISWI